MDNTIRISVDHAQEAMEKLQDADICFVMTEGQHFHSFEFIDSNDLRDADSILKNIIEKSFDSGISN